MTLDQEQEAAVYSSARRLRIKAGAGTGKTMVLVARIKNLIESGVPPKAIAAITFTRAAGEELRRRLRPYGATMTIGTIHALGRQMIETITGAPPRLADPSLRLDLVLAAARACLLQLPNEAALADLADAVSNVKAGGRSNTILGTVVGEYNRLLWGKGLCDFDDLITRPLNLLGNGAKTAREPWLRRYQHVLVDEAQDTTNAEWRLIECLIDHDTNLCVVGDAMQSIYGFRGAQPAIFLRNLEQVGFHFGPFETLELGCNYRSTPPILDLANAITVGMEGAVQLRGPAGAAHLYPHVLSTWNTDAISEARAIVGTASAILDADSELSVAVLARTNAQLPAIVRSARDAGISPAVPITTIHGAKGREWDAVILAGLTNGVLPHVSGDIDEERRLLYVAITRARHSLTLSVAGVPSEFVQLCEESLSRADTLPSSTMRTTGA